MTNFMWRGFADEGNSIGKSLCKLKLFIILDISPEILWQQVIARNSSQCAY